MLRWPDYFADPPSDTTSGDVNLLGLRELAHDTQLQEAIRAGFQAASVPDVARSLTVQSTLTSLATKKRKLLDLYYADRIDGSTFSVEERRLSAQMALLEAELEDQHEKRLKNKPNRRPSPRSLSNSPRSTSTRSGTKPLRLSEGYLLRISLKISTYIRTDSRFR